MKKALFLDRDGVLNLDIGYLFRAEDWDWRPGGRTLCAGAHLKGYLLIIVTNQSGIARGRYQESDVRLLHAWVKSRLAEANIPLTDAFFCPHHPAYTGACLCRKPGSLMIERAAGLYDIDLAASWMIGDAARDVEAGKSAGCRTALLAPAASPYADLILQNPADLLESL